MEIPYSLYNWLRDCRVLNGIYEKTGYNIVLNESDSDRLELGLVLKLFPPIFTNLPKETEMQQFNSKVSRLNNWNLLIKPLEHLGIEINSDMKALIVAGDREQVIEVLQTMYKSITILTKKNPNITSFEGGVLLNNLNPGSYLNETQSVMEFLVLSLCKVLKVTPKVSVGLLAQNGSFLAQIIKKGVKKDFKPILEWYEIIENNYQHLLKHIREEGYFNSAMNLFKSGFASLSEEVQDTCFKFFSNILTALGDNSDLAFKWFSSSPNLLNQVFQLLQSLIDPTNVVNFIILYSNLNYELFWTDLRDYCSGIVKYVKLISKLIPCFIFLDVINDLFNSGLVDCWINLALSSPDSEIQGKGQYLMFLCDIWCYFIDSFKDHEDLAVSIINFMKKVIRDGNKSLKILALGQIFELFDNFTYQKVKYAPILFKSLIFILVEHYHNYKIREFILANLTRIISEHESIPLSHLVDPVVKQAMLLKTLSFQIFDFDFYVALSRHPNLSIKDGVLLIDLCGKIITSDSVYSLASEVPFLIISSRFIRFIPFQDYILKLFSIIFNIHANKKFYTEVFRGKDRRPIILMQKIVELNCEEFNFKLRSMLSHVFNDIKSVKDPEFELLLKVLIDDSNGMFLVPISESNNKVEIFQSTLNYNAPLRAQQEIDKIRNKRLFRENQEKLLIEKKSIQQIVEKFNLQKEIKKRRIELGVKSRLDDDNMLIVDSARTTQNLGFCRIQEEMVEVQKLLRGLIKRYSRVNRAIFLRYAGSTYKQPGSMTPSFDKMSRKKEELTESDFSLFLKQFSILNQKISLSEMKSLFAGLCKQSSKKITFEDFPDLLYMLSTLISNKNPALNKLPEVLVLNDFYFALMQNSGSMVPRTLFEDPDPGCADRDVIQALNQKLEKDPNMALNENYKKYEELQIKVFYEVPVGKKSQRRVIKILDELLFDTFGFHFLLPTFTTSVKIRAKGVLVPEDSAPRYLKKVESNPRFLKLSNHLKLHAIQLNQPEEIVIECSKLIDDLIFTLEKGKRNVVSKTPKPAGSFMNKFLQEKEYSEMEKTLQVQRSEDKRRMRHQVINEKVEKYRVDKAYKEVLDNRERSRTLMQDRIKELEKMKLKKLEKMEIERKIMEYKLAKSGESPSKPVSSVKNFKISSIVDVNSISPLRALNVLKDGKKLIQKEKEINKSSSVPKGFSKLFARD